MAVSVDLELSKFSPWKDRLCNCAQFRAIASPHPPPQLDLRAVGSVSSPSDETNKPDIRLAHVKEPATAAGPTTQPLSFRTSVEISPDVRDWLRLCGTTLSRLTFLRESDPEINEEN